MPTLPNTKIGFLLFLLLPEAASFVKAAWFLKLFKFLAKLMLDRFFATATIRFEAGKVAHVETETRRRWRYKDLRGETKAAHE